MIDEGAIKFHAEHCQEKLVPSRYAEVACQLVAWREILALTGLVGQRAGLYGGFGYGNVSGRVGPPSAPRGQRSFLITGTQTSGKTCMTLADFCVVDRCDARQNRVFSRGEVLPSSESMTHAAVYDLGSHVRFVFHVHSPLIWRQMRGLRLPVSDPQVAYGTQDMVREVHRLYRAGSLSEVQILAMGGHEDGIIVFGRSADEAGQVLMRYLARGYGHVCAFTEPSLNFRT